MCFNATANCPEVHNKDKFHLTKLAAYSAELEDKSKSFKAAFERFQEAQKRLYEELKVCAVNGTLENPKVEIEDIENMGGPVEDLVLNT